MFWPLSYKSVLELRGIRNELLLHKELNTYGSYEYEPGIRFVWSVQGFRLELPPHCELESEGTKIKSPQEQNHIHLFWSKIPQSLILKFENGCRLEIQRKNAKQFFPQPIRLRLAVLCLGVFANFGAILVAYLGALQSMELAQTKLLERQTQVDDLRKIEDVALVRSVHHSKVGTESENSNTTRQLSRLLDSWGAGRPIQSANEVLPKERAYAQLRQKLSLSDAKAWQSEFETSTDNSGQALNLSDSQIAQAFMPLIPRLKECYDEVLIRDQSLEGKPEIWIDINKNGSVENVKVENLRANKAESILDFKTCLREVYARVQLPQPNQAFSVRYTLILQQTKASL